MAQRLSVFKVIKIGLWRRGPKSNTVHKGFADLFGALKVEEIREFVRRFVQWNPCLRPASLLGRVPRSRPISCMLLTSGPHLSIMAMLYNMAELIHKAM